MAKIFLVFTPFIPHTSALFRPFPERYDQQFTFTERRLYGDLADILSSGMCTRNTSLSPLQRYAARAQWRIHDLREVRPRHHETGTAAGESRAVHDGPAR